MLQPQMRELDLHSVNSRGDCAAQRESVFTGRRPVSGQGRLWGIEWHLFLAGLVHNCGEGLAGAYGLELPGDRLRHIAAATHLHMLCT